MDNAQAELPIIEPGDVPNHKLYEDFYFECFWEAYPRKVAKKKARQIWTGLKVDQKLLTKILVAIEEYKKTEQWSDSVRFIPHPTTFLSQRRWEDEIPKPRAKTTWSDFGDDYGEIRTVDIHV